MSEQIEYDFDGILLRLKAGLRGEVSAMEGTFAGDILQAVAVELARVWSQEIDTVTQRGFVMTAEGVWLDQLCGNYGMARKSGESDEALRLRVLERIRQRGASGNIANYVSWAKEVEGVTAATALPLARGAGTVDLYFAAPGGGSEMGAVMTQYIQARRPVGADVRIIQAQPLTVNIQAVVNLDDSVALKEIQTRLAKKLNTFFQEMGLSQTGQLVSLNRVIGLLMNCQGVADASGVRINGSGVNLSIPLGKYAVLGTVDLEEAGNE